MLLLVRNRSLAIPLVLGLACGESGESAPASEPESAPEAPAEAPAPAGPDEAAADPEPAQEPTEPAGASVVQAFVPKTPAEYVGKHVVLASGAVVRSAPDDEATSAVVRRDGGAEGLVAVGTMEVVGSEGEFIAVRPALEDKRCAGTLPGLDAFDIKLWVRPHELSPVVGVRAEVRDASGDTAVLLPGAPVGENGQSAVVDVGGPVLEVGLDPALITTAFDPEPRPTGPDDAQELEAGSPLRWGGKPIDDADLYGETEGHPVAVPGDNDAVTVFARCGILTGTNFGGRTMSPRRPRGGLYAMRGPAGTLGLYGAMREDESWSMSSGAVVYWPDGSEAGSLTARLELDKAPRKRKGKQCFRVALVDEPAPKKIAKDARLQLCFDDSAVHHDPGMASLLSALSAPAHGSAFGSALGKMEDLDSDVWGGLTGTEIGEAYGVGGLGIGGIGRGGGGTGEGTLGLGSTGLGGSPSPGGKASVGGTSVSEGDLDPSVARRITRAHSSDIQSCYDEVRAKDEAASGTVKAEITVDASGKVTAVSISNDTVGHGADACISKKAKGWKFPSSSSSSTLVISFTFSSV